jgi:hypothetical protein
MDTRKNNSASISELISPAQDFQRRKQATWRKQMKPDYSRFKASIRYVDKDDYKPMFSIDLNRKKQDSEKSGLYGLYEWALKCLQNERLVSMKIYLTTRADKKTDQMDYDTQVFFFDRTMTMDKFKCIEQLRFDSVSERVIFDLALMTEIKRQADERATVKELRYRYSSNR